MLDCNQLPIASETHFFMWLSGGTGKLLGMYDALAQRWNDVSPPRWRRECDGHRPRHPTMLATPPRTTLVAATVVAFSNFFGTFYF